MAKIHIASILVLWHEYLLWNIQDYMPTTLTKSILEIDDLQGISPNFEQIKIIPQETAQKIETLIFAKDKNTLKILTTNNLPQ
ncbi:MAG: hypothetical protein WCL02_01415 [bacterium]